MAKIVPQGPHRVAMLGLSVFGSPWGSNGVQRVKKSLFFVKSLVLKHTNIDSQIMTSLIKFPKGCFEEGSLVSKQDQKSIDLALETNKKKQKKQKKQEKQEKQKK